MNSEPEYIVIYKKLRDDIISGAYALGSKIPSKRVCADRFGVSVITVEHAYELLEDEGYIISRERSGYFVSYDSRQALGENRPFQDILGQNDIITHYAPENASESLSEPPAGMESAPGTTGRQP